MLTGHLQTRRLPARIAGWVVASPHRVQDAPAEGWRPFGRRHALLPGSQVTACGADAQLWRVFVDLAFDNGDAQACPACAAMFSVARERVPVAL
jgi:hypothetical protein